MFMERRGFDNEFVELGFYISMIPFFIYTIIIVILAKIVMSEKLQKQFFMTEEERIMIEHWRRLKND